AYSRSSSTSIVRSPILAFSRRFSSSSGEGSRVFRFASAPRRNASFHSDSFAAVTPSSRDSVSRSSPFSSRRTASAFLLAVYRPRSSFFLFDICTSDEDDPALKEVSQEIVGRGRRQGPPSRWDRRVRPDGTQVEGKEQAASAGSALGDLVEPRADLAPAEDRIPR